MKSKKSNAMCLEYWLEKTDGNLEEANNLHIQYKKSVVPSCIEFWLKKGFTEEESKIKVSELQQKKSIKSANNRKEGKHNNKLSTRLEYWLEKTNGNLEEAERLLKERQSTGSLKKFIERANGNIEEGMKNWLARQEKWQNTLNSKSIEEKLEINYKRVKQFFIDDYKKNSISEPEKILKSILKCESQIKVGSYFYDLFLENKIIEFNGDYWHCNPKKYKPNYYNKRTNCLAKDLWKRDEIKNEYAKQNGYSILVVWEDEFKECPEKTIDKCRIFLHGESNARINVNNERSF